MKMKYPKERAGLAYAVIFTLLLAVSLVGLVIIKNYTGFAGYMMNASASTITTLKIEQVAPTSYWAGAYGRFNIELSSLLPQQHLTVSVGDITNYNITMDCFGSSGTDIYFSEVWYNELTIPFEPVTHEELDDYLNSFTGAMDTPSRTLNENITVNIGGDILKTIGGHTNQKGLETGEDFDFFVIKDHSGHFLFGTHVVGLEQAYNGALVNYQLMIPINVSNKKLYVFGDPVSDPFGNCTTSENVFLRGWVFDRYTGDTLDHVQVSISNLKTSTSNSSSDKGYYALLVESGSYYIYAKKEGYMSHIGNITLEPGKAYEYNISLIPLFGLQEPNGTGIINGTIRDNESYEPIEDVFLSIGESTDRTDEFGHYLVPGFVGNKTIVGFKDGYNPFIGSAVIKSLETTTYDINMTKISGLTPPKGNLTGRVINITGDLVEGASVYFATTKYNSSTDVNGTYSLSAPEDEYFVVVEKTGYKRQISLVEIERNIEKTMNFRLIRDVIAREGGTACRNLTAGVPYEFLFEYDDPIKITITLNQSMNESCISAEVFDEKPDTVTNPQFYSTGKYYSFNSNINDSIIANLTFTIHYDEDDIGDQFRESYLAVYYHNSSNKWEEQSINVSDLNRDNNTITLQADHFSYYSLGSRTNKLYGTVKFAGMPVTGNVTIYSETKKVEPDNLGRYEMSDIDPGRNNLLILIGKEYNTHIFYYNLSPGDYLNHNIELSKYQKPGPGYMPGLGTGSGPGAGEGEGAGMGPGTGLREIKANRDAVVLYASIDRINKKLRKGSFAEENITIHNRMKLPAEFKLNVTGDVAPLIKLSHKSVKLGANESKEVNLRISGNAKPGFYSGFLKISGEKDIHIPIAIEITKESKIEVKSLMMKIESLDDVGYRGKTLRYKTEITNLLSENDFFVKLNYTIRASNSSEEIGIGSEVIRPSAYVSLIREYDVPENLSLGTYVLSVEASYFGFKSRSNTLFNVKDELYKYKLFGVLPLWLLGAIISTILFGLMGYMFVRYEQNKHKRFHVNVDYKALPKPGDRSLFVGNIAETNKKAYMDMDKLTVHTIVAGSTGGGKSISAQDIVEECLEKDVGVVVFDPTAQWSGMLRKLSDKKFLSFYPKFGMNPKKDARAYPGNIKAIKDYRQKIDIFKYMKPGEIQVFTTNKLDPKNYDIFVANMIRQIFRSNLEEFRGLRYLIIFDEIHRILPKFGGSGAGFTQIERGCREFRKWGIGILLISQVLSDFVGEIKANINTQVQMKTRDESDLNRIKMQYGEEFIQELVKAPVGSGMVQNSSWNNGKPYYVTFRPIKHSVVRLKDDELDLFNQYNEIVEDLQFQLEQLEQEGQDVFDLKLELKLAVDKIKSGNFNMVKIYLDGLTPRIQKFWDKIGKEPKHLEVELVSDEEIQEDLKKAVEEKKAAGKS